MTRRSPRDYYRYLVRLGHSYELYSLQEFFFAEERRWSHSQVRDAWERALAGDGEAIARGDIEKKIKAARRRLGRK